MKKQLNSYYISLRGGSNFYAKLVVIATSKHSALISIFEQIPINMDVTCSFDKSLEGNVCNLN